MQGVAALHNRIQSSLHAGLALQQVGELSIEFELSLNFSSELVLCTALQHYS